MSAELGIGGYPSVAESTMVARDLALAAYESRPLHILHLRHVSRSTSFVARTAGVEWRAERSRTIFASRPFAPSIRTSR